MKYYNDHVELEVFLFVSCFMVFVVFTAYAAPEVLLSFRGYNSKCDMWSLGIIVYTLLVAGLPYNHITVNDLRR